MPSFFIIIFFLYAYSPPPPVRHYFLTPPMEICAVRWLIHKTRAIRVVPISHIYSYTYTVWEYRFFDGRTSLQAMVNNDKSNDNHLL